MNKIDPHTKQTSSTLLRQYINQLHVKAFQIEPCDRSTKKDVQKNIDKYFNSSQKGVVLIIEER